MEIKFYFINSEMSLFLSLKIAFNFHRVIEATRYLAQKEKLILDLHSENIIIMLPEFELRIFDFHVLMSTCMTW